jgi:hypothetical protein
LALVILHYLIATTVFPDVCPTTAVTVVEFVSVTYPVPLLPLLEDPRKMILLFAVFTADIVAVFDVAGNATDIMPFNYLLYPPSQKESNLSYPPKDL